MSGASQRRTPNWWLALQTTKVRLKQATQLFWGFCRSKEPRGETLRSECVWVYLHINTQFDLYKASVAVRIEMSVSRSSRHVHYFGPEWNISADFRWIAMKSLLFPTPSVYLMKWQLLYKRFRDARGWKMVSIHPFPFSMAFQTFLSPTTHPGGSLRRSQARWVLGLLPVGRAGNTSKGRCPGVILIRCPD